MKPKSLEELIHKVRKEKAGALPLTYVFGETEMKWLSNTRNF